MKRLVSILITAMAVAACGTPAADDQRKSAAADRPTVQLPVLPGRPGAAYFSIDVPADHGALIGVTSPQAGRIEMHETMQQGSLSGMRPAERFAPEGGRIVLARGGRHLMLFDVNPRLAAGGRAQLELRFEHGQTRTLDAAVVDAAGDHGSH